MIWSCNQYTPVYPHMKYQENAPSEHLVYLISYGNVAAVKLQRSILVKFVVLTNLVLLIS